MKLDPRKLKIVLGPASAWWKHIPKDYVATSFEEMMWPAIHAAKDNMAHKGGPFGCATYLPQQVRLHQGKTVPFEKIKKHPSILRDLRLENVTAWNLLSIGANSVVEKGQACYHAEVLAGVLASEYLRKAGFLKP